MFTKNLLERSDHPLTAGPPAGLLAPPPPPHMALPKPWLFPRAAIVPYQGNYKGPRRDRFNDRYNQNSKYLTNVNRMRG